MCFADISTGEVRLALVDGHDARHRADDEARAVGADVIDVLVERLDPPALGHHVLNLAFHTLRPRPGERDLAVHYLVVAVLRGLDDDAL